MTKKDLEEIRKMMILTFNDGFEQVVVPRLEEIEERIESVNRDLKAEFKKGQQSLSNRFEEMERKMDLIVKSDIEQNKRLDRVERIVKAN